MLPVAPSQISGVAGVEAAYLQQQVGVEGGAALVAGIPSYDAMPTDLQSGLRARHLRVHTLRLTPVL